VIPVTIVGAGVIGANHAEAVQRHPGLRVAAVVDPWTAAARDLAARVASATGATPACHASLTDALAAVHSGLVVICTPTGLHAAAAEEALAAGCHVVIEKPLDVSLPRARRLAEVAARAETHGLVASVISQRRFDAASLAVAGAVAAGRLGRITSAVASVPWWRGQDYYDSAAWRGTWALDGGGALMNQGIHTVDLLVWLLGRPVEVSAWTGLLGHRGIEVEDVAVAMLRFADGALATLHATTAAYPGLGVRVQIHGTQGSAVLQDDQLAELHTGDGAAIPPEALHGAPKPPDGFVLGHLRQYEDVVEAIERRRPPAVRVADGLDALAVVTAVYLSARLGRPVTLDDVLAGKHDDQVAAA